jgi:hypothetical protein
MAARALVAYERPDGRYNLHYAHWGATADLQSDITPATPFGSTDPRAEWAAGLLRELLTATGLNPATVQGRVPRDASSRVDPAPLAVGVERGRIAASVDFGTHEAVHVVDRSFGVTPYLAVPFSLAAVAERRAESAAPGGALVPVDGSFDALRERAAGAREALGAAVDGGVDPATARAALRTTLVRWVGEERLLASGDSGDSDPDAGP